MGVLTTQHLNHNLRAGKDKTLSENDSASILSQAPIGNTSSHDLQAQGDYIPLNDDVDADQREPEDAQQPVERLDADVAPDILPMTYLMLDEGEKNMQQVITEDDAPVFQQADIKSLLYNDFAADIDIQLANRQLPVQQPRVEVDLYIPDDPLQLAHRALDLPRLVLNPPNLEVGDQIFTQEGLFLIPAVDKKIELRMDFMLIHQQEGLLYERRFADEGFLDGFDPFFIEDEGIFAQEFGHDCIQRSDQAVLADL